MKLGYSNILGEYLKAESLEYKDCEKFQIVCPACREPVFKVAGHRVEISVDYLSHYRRDSSYDAECELRVSRIGAAEIEKENYQSREQRLKYFMGAFREMLIESEYPGNSETEALRLFDKMNRSKALVLLRDQIYQVCKINSRDSAHKEQFEGYFEDYINDIKEEMAGKFYDTTFSIQVQKRIASDIWLHLLSHIGKENWFFLFNHSYTFLLSRIRSAAQTRKLYEWEMFLVDRMEGLIAKNKQHGMTIIAELMNYRMGPPFAIKGHSLIHKMGGDIAHEMLGTLLRLPYFEHLRNKTMPNAMMQPTPYSRG